MKNRSRTGPPQSSCLKGANVLILDDSHASASQLRTEMEDLEAFVEIAPTADDALDVLGRAARPVLLAMLETTTDGDACAAVMRVLRQHNARIHVTLHGRRMPERHPEAREMLGAAAFIRQTTPSLSASIAEAVIRGDFTVRRIMETRTVPDTMDPGPALAIYGAGPGHPFPSTPRF
jgi:CheY-like chemotaxis protein